MLQRSFCTGCGPTGARCTNRPGVVCKRRFNRAIRVYNSTAGVNDARNLPKEVLVLQGISPGRFAVTALDGQKFAWFKPAGPTGPDALLAADPATVQSWFTDEWALGSITGWPSSISQLLGAEAMANTRKPDQHKRLREIFGVMLSDEQMARVLPGIRSTVQKYLRSWAAKGTVPAYTETLTLVFDILVNQAMQLGWSDADIQQYARVFEVWNQGFTPVADPSPDSAWSKGMKARVDLIARFRKSLSGPGLVPGSIPAVLRDTYGASSDICTDNLIMVIFAGFETTASAVVGILYHLPQHPAVFGKLRDEHKILASQYGGPNLSLASLKDMTYTEAIISETMRLSQIVANVPRIATKPIDTPNAPTVPAGCPFSASWAGMSVLDPAVQEDPKAFRPGRWLLAKNKSSLKLHQHPFGYGTHSCLGYRVARATAAAVAQDVALSYGLTADYKTDFNDFPTGGRPRNELPVTLKPLAA